MNAPRLSVIIPALDEAAALPPTLARLSRLAPDAEVVVVDGGSRDGTWQLRRRFTQVRFVRSQRGRGPQMNTGGAVARGSTLLFLHADTHPPVGMPGLIEEALSRRGVAAGSFCLQLEPASPLLRLYSLCSRINHPLFTYGDQGLFLRRETFDAVGGYRDTPIFEDLYLMRELRRHGRVVTLPAPLPTSPRRCARDGILRTVLRNQVLLLGERLGVAPERLARLRAPAGGREAQGDDPKECGEQGRSRIPPAYRTGRSATSGPQGLPRRGRGSPVAPAPTREAGRARPTSVPDAADCHVARPVKEASPSSCLPPLPAFLRWRPRPSGTPGRSGLFDSHEQEP